MSANTSTAPLRRCLICQHDRGLAPAKKPELRGSWFCRNFIECNKRARLRLGIQKWTVSRLAREEKEEAARVLRGGQTGSEGSPARSAETKAV